jgi:hypothetical protein
MYLARRHRIFDVAANAVLSLGTEFLNGFDTLVVFETRAVPGADDCLLISGSTEALKPIFLVLDVKRKWTWLLRRSYHVGVFWDVPEQCINPLLRLCDPTAAVDRSGSGPEGEPLVLRFSRLFPEKKVVGCRPGYFAKLDIVRGKINLAMYRQA